MEEPSNAESSGRGSDGRFTAGNTCGKGNPHLKQFAVLRSALLNAITPEDIDAVVKQLIAKAKDGNVIAIKELLDRAVGKPVAHIAVSDAVDAFKVYLGEAAEKV